MFWAINNSLEHLDRLVDETQIAAHYSPEDILLMTEALKHAYASISHCLWVI